MKTARFFFVALGIGSAGALAATARVDPDVAAAPAAHTGMQRAAETLNVMSFNIRYGTARDGDNAWEHRRDAVTEIIEAFRVHVLGVQEALHFQLEEIEARLPGYRRIGVGRDDGDEAGEYSAILIDTARLEVLDEGTFWFSDTPDVPGSTSWGNTIPRICTWARLRDGVSGTTFRIYNVHWDHVSQPSRERSAELLVETISQHAEPVLITGDFNAGEDNPAFRHLLESDPATALGLFDTFRAVHPDAEQAGTFNGFTGATDGDKIDAVLASNQWAVLAADIVRTARQGRYPSDHFPVVATVVLR